MSLGDLVSLTFAKKFERIRMGGLFFASFGSDYEFLACFDDVESFLSLGNVS